MNKKRSVLPTIALLVIIIGIWEVAPRIFSIPEFIITPFSSVVTEIINQWSDVLQSATTTTVTEMLLGILAAFVLSVIVAITLNSFAAVRQFLYPLLVASQAIPVIVIAPVFAIILGYGIESKVIVVTIQCFFPITVSFLSGLAAVEQEKLNLMKTLYGTRTSTFLRLELPSSLPYLFSGLRVAVSYAPVAALFAEYTGSEDGLGYVMIQAIPQMQTSLVWGEVLILTALSLLMFGVVVLLERVFCSWAKHA